MRFDPFVASLFGAILVASLWPLPVAAAGYLALLVNVAIALLFFVHGAKVSRAAVWAGLSNVRLQSLALLMTFMAFPAIGFGLQALMPSFLPQPLWWGLIFLCLLPSTIQSSVAFVAIARGDVPAALCAATLSNLLGIFLTPLLVAFLMTGGGVHIDSGRVLQVVVQLLLPFLLGQLLHPKIGPWFKDHMRALTFYDRGTIVLAVYSAFTAAMHHHLWEKLAPAHLLLLLAILTLLLGGIWAMTRLAARMVGLSMAEATTLLYCGTQKSLASGIPMANVLFSPALTGMIVLPLMLYHQLQLLAASFTASRLARAAKTLNAGDAP